MKKISKIVISAWIALLPLSAIAHAGHGHDNPLSSGHYVNNPQHSFPLTLAIASMVVLITWLAYRKKSITK
jgi:hypothetical protein